jgi:AsmA protein
LNATAFNHPTGGVIDGHLALQGNKLASLLTAMGQAELAKSVRTVKFEAGLKGNAQTLAMSPFVGNVEIRGPDGAPPVDLKLTVGTAEANLTRETLSIKDLALTGLGLNVKGGLEATEIKSALRYTGQLSVPIFNLRQVLATLNKPLTGMADPAALTQVGFEATVHGTARRHALSGLSLKFDETTLKGDLAVDNSAAQAVNFKLLADRLNADRYLAPKNAAHAKPVTPEAAAVGAAQLPVATLRKINVDGKLAIGNLQFAGAKLTNVAVALQGRDGKLGLNPASADLYGGRYTGEVTLDATGKIPELALNTTLAKVAIEPLLVDTTGKSAFVGAVNFEAKLRARGSKSSQLLHSLTGPASFAITDGVLRGIDVPAVLQAAELIIESKSLQPVPRGGTTQFQSLTGSLDIQNGALYNHDLLLDGAGFKVSGDGLLANLNDNTTKYDARIAVDQGSQEQGATHYTLGDYVIPIRCRGPISSTSCLPDFGELAKVAATKALRDQVEKKLDKSLGGAGKALKNLLKF